MEETFKTRVISILGILTVIMCIGWVGSCLDARQYKSSRLEEMHKRLDAEEKMSKFSLEKPALEEKLRSTEKELQDEKAGHQATKTALSQEQLVNQSLKEEILKVIKLKDALEENLKDSLVQGKSAKPKK
jgi:hypothetical protein